MNFESKQQFMAAVGAMVQGGHVTIAELVDVGTHALEQKLERVNQMRVDAEFALTMIVDLVPSSKHAKHAVAMTKAKKVLVNSGSFAGTEMAEKLKAEIMSTGNAEKG